MEEDLTNLKLDYKFDLEDFIVIENIEHSYFPDDNITSAEEVMKWYKKNNLTCVGVRNADNKIIASVNILPLKKEVFSDIYENRMNEADIVDNQIEEYKDGNSYYMYLSSISIDKKYRNSYKLITTLLRGCNNLCDILVKRDIKIEKIMADASTIHGEKICKKLLKMHYITDTSHDSKIYCADGEKFIETMKKIKNI